MAPALPAADPRQPRVLVVDVGGSSVKMLATGRDQPARFASGSQLTADALVRRVTQLTAGWKYDVISIGFPGTISGDAIAAEPSNLGRDWVGYDFQAAFRRPVRVVNDAVLQALGAYDGGRMVFLGLGTAVGSAFVVDRIIVPLELGDLSYRLHETVAQRLGKGGLAQRGISVWQRSVRHVARMVRAAFRADYLVLGGGNAKKMDRLPRNVRRGGNHDAFLGGFRLWDESVEPHDRPPPRSWRILG